MIKEMHKTYCHQHQASKTVNSFDYILINVFFYSHSIFLKINFPITLTIGTNSFYNALIL